MESFHLGGVWGRRFGLAKLGRVFVEKFKDLLCGEAACAQGAHRLGAKHRRRKAVALELWRRKLQINKSTRFFKSIPRERSASGSGCSWEQRRARSFFRR